MSHRADLHIETGNRFVPTQSRGVSCRRWWHILLRFLGSSRTPEIEHTWRDGQPEPWSLEEDRVLQCYHARNLAAARQATEMLVREGWHIGPVPYGYRPLRIRITPVGRRPRYRTRLLIEPVEASVVEMIFWWRVHYGLPVDGIVQRLTSARHPAPIRLATIEPDEWTSAVVQTILSNPKYTGYQVWGRTHNGSMVPSEHWVWSGPGAHPPVVDTEIFLAAQRLSSRVSDHPATDGHVARERRSRRSTPPTGNRHV